MAAYSARAGVPERLELCVAVPVTILLHSDRAVRRGEPITAEASIEHQCGNSNLVSRSPHMGDCVGIRRHQSREQITAATWMMLARRMPQMVPAVVSTASH